MSSTELEDFLASLFKALETHQRHIHLEGLWETSKDFLIALLRGRLAEPFLVLTPSLDVAEDVYKNIQFFISHLWPKKDENLSLHLFPTWETLPYEAQSPVPELVAQRVGSLYALLNCSSAIVVAPVQAAMQSLLPKRVLNAAAGYFEPGEIIEREEIIGLLVHGGYRAVDLVEDPGDFSVRGGVLDCFSPGQAAPVRLEFFGDTIESIRHFNPSTQRSESYVKEVVILPITEAILTRESCHHCSLRLKEEYGHSYLYQSKIQHLQAQLESLRPFPGVEQYVPFLYSRTDSLFQYLPSQGHIFLYEPSALQRAAEEYQNEVERRYQKSHRENIPYPHPREGYYFWTEIQKEFFSTRQTFSLRALKEGAVSDEPEPDTVPFEVKSVGGLLGKSKILKKDRSFFEGLLSEIKYWHRNHQTIVLVCHSEGQAERTEELFHEYEVGVRRISDTRLPITSEQGRQPAPPLICLGELSHGFYLPFLSLIIITDQEIFGERKKVTALKKSRTATFLSTFRDLSEGDYVVHVEHGIGRYLGLKKIAAGEIRKDFMVIEYFGGDKLYIPPEKLHFVQKYSGSGGAIPKLDKLGSSVWAKTKARVKESVRKMAEDLLKLYAAREMAIGLPAPPDTPWQHEFEASFEYEETPDQAKAIQEVKLDMEQSRPMDRLVCGDVGYGKTEVALRAAFKAVTGNRQVALIAPTTLLVEQHFQKFSQRMAPYPIRVDMLSRFRSRKQQQETIEGLRTGLVDIVIGTHRLLQKDVTFHDLGLVVIDEEQRFGVAHKERLKTLRKSVDILTLTATPIPRTLNMALMGIRDLSVIDTPPENRLAIQTHIIPFDPDIVIEAIVREMDRGGQVFFVHNHVEDIDRICNYVRSLVPSARIAVAHGQMQERELERVMLDFVQHKYDILLCTTIIESGLDISAANTIIIHQAHHYGLAQLYQLRGRVGRSSRRAYAYLLIPSEDTLSDEARKRLIAIQELSELGSGFRLAARDLEIRGAGNLLGAEQHGHIAAVGFDLYCDLIHQTIQELQGKEIETRTEINIDLQVEAYLPDFYVPDTNQRLNLYKRASLITEVEALKVWKEELEDRYGMMPEAARLFSLQLELRLFCQKWKISAVQRKGNQVSFTFNENTPVALEVLIELVREGAGDYWLIPPNAFGMVVTSSGGESLFREIQDFFLLLEKGLVPAS
ncbi:MAG: transcription-repair coupling factor [bacterium]